MRLSPISPTSVGLRRIGPKWR